MPVTYDGSSSAAAEAAAVLLIQIFLILSRTDITGYSRALFSPFATKTAEQKERENKTKERNKGKVQSTAVPARPPRSRSPPQPSPPGPPRRHHAPDPGIPQEIQDRLRRSLIPRVPDRGAAGVSTSFKPTFHNIRRRVKRWCRDRGLAADAPPALAGVGLLDLVVEVSPYRRVPRQELVAAAGKRFPHPSKV
jgi:hypothetical protein